MMSRSDFEQQVLSIAGKISGRTVDGALQDYLNQQFPADGPTFQSLARACRQGIDAVWRCPPEAAAVRCVRAATPAPTVATHNRRTARRSWSNAPAPATGVRTSERRMPTTAALKTKPITRRNTAGVNVRVSVDA